MIKKTQNSKMKTLLFITYFYFHFFSVHNRGMYAMCASVNVENIVFEVHFFYRSEKKYKVSVLDHISKRNLFLCNEGKLLVNKTSLTIFFLNRNR